MGLHATHVAQRIKAANGSFFKRQAAGMHDGGLSPDAIRHMVHSKNRLVETTRKLVDMCLTKLFG